MIAPQNAAAFTSSPPDLRLWPGVVLVALQWVVRFVLPAAVPSALPYGVMGGLALGPLILIWWVFFSRAPRAERWGGLAMIVAALLATSQVLDASIATGMMGMMFPIYAVPGVCLALVLWAVLTRRVTGRARLATLALAIFAACGVWALVRTAGFTGDLDHDFAFRWAPSHEDRLVAEQEEPVGLAPAPETDPKAETGPDAEAETGPAAWPGFRGPRRDGVARSPEGLRFVTDWTVAPPEELWRRDVGPGWGSFAVGGDLLYTQEQRGEEEVVACYRLSTGEPVWRHGDPVRFWESNGGPGPRATPTLDGDLVFTLGATGRVNALRALDGTPVWSADAAADTGTETPTWGYSGSPLVDGDRVLVAASGRLVAYQRDTGERLWTGPEGGEGYSSPQLVTLGGTRQVLQLSGDGLVSLDPATGSVHWRHDWQGYPIVQPALTPDGDVLLAVSDRSGLRRLSVEPGADGWTATERWSSIRLKPYFDDFVVHVDHAYGFDGRILAAIDLATGERAWKGGRYGNGQMILLPAQDLLLVLSEDGELALVSATPDAYEELALVPALDGRTWNHPVLVGDRLLVRNGREMAAYRLATEGS